MCRPGAGRSRVERRASGVVASCKSCFLIRERLARLLFRHDRVFCIARQPGASHVTGAVCPAPSEEFRQTIERPADGNPSLIDVCQVGICHTPGQSIGLGNRLVTSAPLFCEFHLDAFCMAAILDPCHFALGPWALPFDVASWQLQQLQLQRHHGFFEGLASKIPPTVRLGD